MKRRQFTTLVIALLLAVTAATFGQFEQHTKPGAQSQINSKSVEVKLSEKRIRHILYGDGTGGGHRHGANKPCKSEFPASWSDQKIIETVKKIAANDNTNWTMQDNGYLVSDTRIENLKIRVVLDPEEPEIITAYPTNVRRNPCTPANDNKP